MKYFTLLACILLVGCNARFKKGDCLVEENSEPWETPAFVYKILEVGNEHYHIEYWKPGNDFTLKDSVHIGMVDDLYRKIDCPEIFK